MEVLVVLVVALLVLGPQKLPEAGRQLGRALSEFRNWSSGLQAELQDALDPEPQPFAPTPVMDVDPDDHPDLATPADLAPDARAEGDDAGTVSFT
jgi:TatA/E family protein of Tat protein translocase